MGKTVVYIIIKDNINEVLKCVNKLIRRLWNQTGLRKDLRAFILNRQVKVGKIVGSIIIKENIN
jgi:hypothetical protein